MTKSIFHRCIALMLIALVAFISTAAGAVSEFSRAWKSPNSSIVLDAYEYTVIDWSKIKNNKRLAGFINKATDGLQPRSNCKRNTVCRLRWRRYAAAKELYHTRKTLAKTLGLKWGAYHLGRPGNPIKQARHFLAFARPGPDDLVAIDIEENDPKRWMSLKEAEIFSQYIFEKLGRYPVLYTNHSTAKYIARNRAEYPLLSRLNLWYARYRASMRGAFPMGNWDSYTIWQFSAHTNCSPQSCLWRINGTDHWIDVNVVNMSVAELRQKWPFNDLTARQSGPRRDKRVPLLMAEALKANPEATLTGYAKQPKVMSAAKMFEALLSKPRMALRGKAPLPSWRPGTVIVAKALQPKEQMIKQPAVIAPKASAVEIAALEPKKPAVAFKPKLETSELVTQKQEMSPQVSKTPVVAAKIPQRVQPKTEAIAGVKVVAKSLVAQINSRNTQHVNALLLETAKNYLAASRNGRTLWEEKTPAPVSPAPVMAVTGLDILPTWRPGTKLEVRVAQVEPNPVTPIVQKPAPRMAAKGKVALPVWRPDSQVAKAERVPTKAKAASKPKTQPVMLVKGEVARPTWRPGAKFAEVKDPLPEQKIAPKMAIAGPVAIPNWRPGTEIRQLVQDDASDVIEIALSASYAPLIADIWILAQRTPVPTWRPDPS